MNGIEHSAGSIPVSIITGFLGSGKTTLLAKLLADPRMRNAAVIINEFGEVPLDHLLVTRPKDDVMVLSSGCMCCTLRGELVDTLGLLYAERERGEIPHFDRVLVETTGLAEPGPILMSIIEDEAIAKLFRIESVVTTVDAVAGRGQLAEHPESVKQVCVADTLLLTKSDLANGSQLELRVEIGRLNSLAEIIEIRHGEVDPALLFDVAGKRSARKLRLVKRRSAEGVSDDRGSGRDHHDHHHNVDHSHSHDPHIGVGVDSFVAVIEEPATASGLQIWTKLLSGFHGPSLLRIKGIVNLEGHPVVLQAVQHMIYPLVELPDWPDDDRRTKLVFIVKDLPRARIEETLSALTMRFGSDGSLSQAAFNHFAAVAQKFR